jgi:hypothetical protein
MTKPPPKKAKPEQEPPVPLPPLPLRLPPPPPPLMNWITGMGINAKGEHMALIKRGDADVIRVLGTAFPANMKQEKCRFCRLSFLLGGRSNTTWNGGTLSARWDFERDCFTDGGPHIGECKLGCLFLPDSCFFSFLSLVLNKMPLPLQAPPLTRPTPPVPPRHHICCCHGQTRLCL